AAVGVGEAVGGAVSSGVSDGVGSGVGLCVTSAPSGLATPVPAPGVVSTRTQPAPSIQASAQACMSLVETAQPPLMSLPGRKPITTRAGTPAPRSRPAVALA